MRPPYQGIIRKVSTRHILVGTLTALRYAIGESEQGADASLQCVHSEIARICEVESAGIHECSHVRPVGVSTPLTATSCGRLGSSADVVF